MRNAFRILLAVFAFGVLAGCEDEFDTQSLRFINSSSFTVTIKSLSSEWVGFVLAPGQERKMSGIRDVDYDFEPDKYVEEGFASTDRYVVFVDIPRDEIQWGN